MIADPANIVRFTGIEVGQNDCHLVLKLVLNSAENTSVVLYDSDLIGTLNKGCLNFQEITSNTGGFHGDEARLNSESPS